MPGDKGRNRLYPNNLKSLIRLHGYKVVEVADELQMPRSTLYDYISGLHPIPKHCLRDITALIGCDISEFYYEGMSGALNGQRDERSTIAAPFTNEDIGLERAKAMEALPRSAIIDQGSMEEQSETFPEPSEQAIHLLAPVNADNPRVDYVVWFGKKLAEIYTLITYGAKSENGYQALQARLNKEFIMFDAIKPQATNEAFTISRRQAIIAVAALPMALLSVVQQGHWSALVKEEFLSRCAASVTACWHLMAGREFAEVERAVTPYLPVLMNWAKQPSLQQKMAADLASQGNLLLSLVALHTLRFPKNLHTRIAYCKQAVEYGKISNNVSLYVTASTHVAATMCGTGQFADSLSIYQKIEHEVRDISPMLRSKLLIEMARAYAYNGQIQETLRYMEQAREALPAAIEPVPVFFSSDSGLFFLIHMEGQARLALGDHQPESDHYEQAWNTLARIEQLPQTAAIPERFRIEIVNHQALAAVKMGDLDRSYVYLQKGIEGAKALSSEKRRQEAVDIYKQARRIWPNEEKIRDLGDLLVSMN